MSYKDLEKHREDHRKANRKYAKAHQKEYEEYTKRWSKENPEKRRAQDERRVKSRRSRNRCIQCGRLLHSDFDAGHKKCIFCREMRRQKLWS
jgi:hypothetical protein